MINAFLRAANRMRGYRGRLELVVPPAPHPLRSVCELTCLGSLLPCTRRAPPGSRASSSEPARREPDTVSLRALVELIEPAPAESEPGRSA